MAVPLFVLRDERKYIRKTRKLLENISDSEIRINTGLPWWGVDRILPIFDELEGQQKHAIPVETKVIGFLSFLRSGTAQWMIGGTAGTSQPSASRIIESASTVLADRAAEFIKFPTSVQELNEVKTCLRFAGFPNVIGLIDGTQCAIKAPKDNEPAFVCRKKFHSINVQVVSNHNHEITDIVVKYPGSTHDSFIWNNSGLRTHLELSRGSGWLLGDSGYPLESFLLTPYSSRTRDPVQILYNTIHSATRCIVERTIGHWKSRYRVIDRYGGYLGYSPQKCCKLILCTAILHNICKANNIPLTEEDTRYYKALEKLTEAERAENDRQDQDLLEQLNLPQSRTASQLRDRIANQFSNG